MHLSHHPVPGEGKQWEEGRQKRREKITNQTGCDFIEIGLEHTMFFEKHEGFNQIV